ncbi:MAG TPA: CAP domain-containing protein [Candidatus Saccharimonadales bacterium]|nr:CAP domain-containing protein [Candidatus Saccharimonadales bacterium]
MRLPFRKIQVASDVSVISSTSKPFSGRLQRLHFLYFILVIGFIGSILLFTGFALTPPNSDEAVQLNDINALRSSLGLKTLVDTDCLNQAAEEWSKQMAADGLNSNGIPVDFKHSDGATATMPATGALITTKYCNFGSGQYVLAENVAWASGCDGLPGGCSQYIFDGFKGSPGHYANMTDSSVNNVGVGSYRDANGILYITQEFMACAGTCPDTTIPGYGYSGPPISPPPSTNLGPLLQSGVDMHDGQYLQSPNGIYQLKYVTNTNRQRVPSIVNTTTGGITTNIFSIGTIVIQSDGNLTQWIPAQSNGQTIKFTSFSLGSNGRWNNTGSNLPDYLYLDNRGVLDLYNHNACIVWNSSSGFTPNGNSCYNPNTNATTASAGNDFSQTQPCLGTTLYAGQIINPGNCLVSSDGVYMFKLSRYGTWQVFKGPDIVWSGATAANPGNIKMQTDGNLVYYDSSGTALWSSKTTNSGSGDYLTMQPDGNLVVNTSLNQTVWSVNTGKINPTPITLGPVLRANQSLYPNESMFSNNILYRLSLQLDGNLVEYNNYTNVAKCNSVTFPCSWRDSKPSRLTMQGDGNLVFYNYLNQKIWSSNTQGTGSNNYFGVQPSGNLVIYNSYNQWVWSKDTGRLYPTPPTPPPTNLGAYLYVNQRMYPNQELVNNGYNLKYQLDGNLVLYNPTGGVIWATGTNGRSLGNLSMQSDGNLVLYNDYGGAMWSTGTNGKGDHNFLVLGGDGNMVVESNQSIPVWGLYQGGYIPEYAPNYWHPQPSNILYAHQLLYPNQSLTSNGYRLTYQSDGNLVEYNSSGVAVWSTKTNGRSTGNLKMQDDGNLVLYNDYGGILWSTGTNGTGGSNYLVIQPDSNIVVYTSSGVPVWSRW